MCEGERVEGGREWRGTVGLSLPRGARSGSPSVRGAPLGLDYGVGRQKRGVENPNPYVYILVMVVGWCGLAGWA